MTIYIELTWPDGSKAIFDLPSYCLLDAEVIRGTKARLVSR